MAYKVVKPTAEMRDQLRKDCEYTGESAFKGCYSIAYRSTKVRNNSWRRPDFQIRGGKQ